jgi:thioredoxin-dependent peroxiredoxin
MTALVAGSLAPDFTVDTDAGTPLTLSSLRGRPVVLYFYPKDDTSGCTTEACEFRDLFPRFDGSKAVILGVSPDSVKSHVKFKTKYELPFTLLADTEKTVAQAYDVWKEKSMYGKKYMGVERTTFLIDAKGMVAKVFAKVKPAGHADEVMSAISALS